MPRKAQAAPVTTRQLAPEPAAEESRDVLLHEPVKQLAKFPPDFQVEYEWFDPEKAQQWLDEADQDPHFWQRPTSMAGIRRWRNLVTTKRFVHFLPNTPICKDPDGVMLNGKHRLMGLTGCPEDAEAGFMVVYNVPRWMFAFFDTNKTRTLKDVFHIGARPHGPQTPSAMKLAMRYEEFLMGLRPATGWRHWNTIKDEHQDVDVFFERREELQDWYGVGEKVYRVARILHPSAMVFRFYQNLAWPEGDAEIQEFTEQLVTPTGRLPKSHPVVQLRTWTQESYINRDQVFAKREVHLMLLFKMFQQSRIGSRIERFTWAFGQPMSMPYHPKGHDVAVKNIRVALDEIDREHAASA